MGVAGVPIFGAIIDFSDGAAFITTALRLDNTTSGKLDTGQLANSDDRVDISDIAIQASIRRGRNRILDKFEAGTATVILKDENGWFNPANTSSPYYGQLIPLRKIQIFADYDGVRYPLFYGYIQSYTTNFTVGVDSVSKVTLQCSDAFRLINNVVFTTVPTATAGETTGSRIGKLLDLAGWPASARKIDTGSSTVQADPGTANRNMLDALQLVADKTEFGGIFADNDGDIYFFSRDKLAKSAANPTTYFADDGSAIGYQAIELAHDDVNIVNDVIVNRLGGTAQEVSDTTSINTYFKRVGVRSDILVQTDAEALAQAQMLLATRKDAVLRIASLGLNLFDPSDSAATRVVAGLSTDIFDPISVKKSMPGGTTITKTLFVQGVQHDMTKRSFDTKLITSEPLIKAFVLNDSQEGILDGVDGLLSY